MKFTLEATEEFLNLPDDAIVQVLVDNIELREQKSRSGETWNKLSFRFKIAEVPTALEAEYGVLIGSTIFGSVSARFSTHPDNKLRQWAEALLAMDLTEPGFELDADMLIGRKARAVIGSYQKKDSVQRNHQVIALLPLVSNAMTGAPTPQEAGFSFDDSPPF